MSTNLAEPVRMARISTEELRVETALAAVSDPGCGGLGIFVGTVRDTDPATTSVPARDRVSALHYTAHPSAEAALAAACASVAARHQVRHVAVEHRIGDLVVGDIAVVVATAAVHRADALQACRDLIDTVKEQVPIWKEQTWSSGATTWSGIQ